MGRRNTIRVCSFFSGLGFLDLGFEAEGFKIDLVNEIHDPFLAAYQHSRKHLQIFNGTAYSNDSIELLLKRKNAKVDSLLREVSQENFSLFIGGPPCPDFSVGGKNRGKEGRNGRLSQTYIDLICLYKPTAFLFENVKGLWRTKRHREFYESLKRKLIRHGYQLTDRLTNALEFGVPQDRDRIFLIGVKKDFINADGHASLEHFKWELHMKYPGARDMPRKVLLQSEKLPDPIPRELTVECWFEKNKVKHHPNYSHGFAPRAGLAKFKSIKEGDDSKKSFKRLHRLRYSPTAAYGNNEVHVHPTEPRRINAAEALAIQSLPPSFRLPDDMTLTNMFKGIGNGVPYLLSRGLARTLREEVFKVSSAKLNNF